MAVNKVVVNGSTIIDVSGDTVDANKLLLDYTATKNNGTKVTGNIAGKSANNLTASGSTVTVPAGFYSSQVTKNIAGGTATTPATTMAITPAITINTATGVITATVNSTKNVTPTIVSGYISAGTAGTITASGSNTSNLTTQAGKTITPTETQQTAVSSGRYTTGSVLVAGISSTYVGTGVTRKAAATYTPTTTAQTIASDQYLTGTQTIEAIPSAYIIPSGVSTITSNGTYNIAEYSQASVSVTAKQDTDRPDLFWLAYLAGGYATTTDPLMQMMSRRIGLSDTYNDSQSTYITPSFVSLSEIKNAYGSSIVNYSFSISKFRSGACAGMCFYENGYPTFPYITSINEQCVFEFAQVSGFSSFDIGLNLLPNVANISGSRIFASIGTGARTNLGATFSELTRLQGNSVFANTYIGYFVGPKISLISAAVCGFQSCRSMSLVSCDVLSYIDGCVSLFAEVSYSSGVDYYLPKLSSVSLCSSAFYRNVIKSMVLTSLTGIRNCSGLFGYATFIPSQISWFSNLTEIYGSPYMFQEVGKSSNENLEIYFNKLALISNCSAMMSRASVTYVGMPSLTTLVNVSYLFYQCYFLEDVNFPKLSSVSSCGSLFAYCSSLKSIAFPELESVMMNAWFSNCTALSTAIFPKLTSMSGAAGFASCHNLISLFLLASSMCTLGVTAAQMFASTPLYNYSTSAGQWGSIFVPSSLLTSYKNATNWTTISSRIFAYEDYFT